MSNIATTINNEGVASVSHHIITTSVANMKNKNVLIMFWLLEIMTLAFGIEQFFMAFKIVGVLLL